MALCSSQVYSVCRLTISFGVWQPRTVPGVILPVSAIRLLVTVIPFEHRFHAPLIAKSGDRGNVD
jgi:hypothetical protein